ncbi:serine hydrolase domain-containing protein [Sphingobium agri]|uniref:Beta-lactamase family protein n=1 Tax=Sphingobium agri TaxID=2933566 RepID=A0ABT0DXR5_9SPHN|nr:serine hydrolase domain-containing protein [Sphingobium agri]MCK0531890.1 beta-lactamase family protein [Sphingobium agri]
MPHAEFVRRDLLKGAICLGMMGAAPGYARAGAKRFPAVRAMVAGVIGEKAVPGAIVAIGERANRPDYISSGTIALDSAVQVDEHTLFRVYSMTKPITGMAAMLLIAEGRMKIDQPVADFIPGFAKMRVLANPGRGVETRPATSAMTIRHLLTHTAGLGGGPAVKGPLKGIYEKLGLRQNLISHAERLEQAPPSSLKDFADRLAAAPLLSDPGTAWSYSVGLDLLGHIIEIVAGMPFEQFLERRFFAPLGMSNTFFSVPESKKARLVTSYTGRSAKLTEVDAGPASIFLNKPAFPSGGGGLISTAHDYDRFLAMLANNGRLGRTEVMPPDAVAAGTANLLPQGVSMRDYLGIPGVVGFGAGGCIADHGGFKGLFGWLGAAGTIGFIVPAQRLRVTGLINNMSVFDFAMNLPKAVHDDLGSARTS